MKAISLDTNTRVHLEFILGGVHGKFSDLESAHRINAQIRLSEDERKAIKLRQNPTDLGVYAWDLEVALASSKKCLFEDVDAVALKGWVTEWPNFRVQDYTWVQKLLGELEAKDAPVDISKRGKRTAAG